MRRRGNWQAGFYQRFGIFDNKIKQALTNRQVLWLHAVSVGEVTICSQLINSLQPRLPNLKMVASTTTTTGMELLNKRLPGNVTKIYYPIDTSTYVSRAMKTIHPNAIVLVESEIWPNFLWRAKKRRVPVMLVNARLSDRSYPRYKRMGFLFRSLFGSFAAVGAQNEADAAKLRELGCRPGSVHVAGCLKFDSVRVNGPSSTVIPELLVKLGVGPTTPVLVAGSTHAGEEQMLAKQFKNLRERFPDLFLVLVPRHFERAKDVGRQLASAGIKFVYRSELEKKSTSETAGMECLLVDTTGELRAFYEHATVVFVGKSVLAKGGQNPIEPAALGKPVVVGPNMQNFADVTRILLEQQGILQVKNAGELERVLGELLADAGKRALLGRNAQRTVLENQGGVENTVELIIEQLKNLSIYVAPVKPVIEPQV
jgi:3-deoxy-D-manno-octulosonic-acid transferase